MATNKDSTKKPVVGVRIEGIGTGAASPKLLGNGADVRHEHSTFIFDPPRKVKRIHAVRDGDGINLTFEEE